MKITMKRYLCASLFSLSIVLSASAAPSDTLADGFKTPPPDARAQAEILRHADDPPPAPRSPPPRGALDAYQKNRTAFDRALHHWPRRDLRCRAVDVERHKMAVSDIHIKKVVVCSTGVRMARYRKMAPRMTPTLDTMIRPLLVRLNSQSPAAPPRKYPPARMIMTGAMVRSTALLS